MTHLDIAEEVTKWGKAALITGALLGGGYTVISKTVATVKAGPEAKAKADELDFRVTRLERQSRFVVKGIEKLTGLKYRPSIGEGGEDAR